MKIVQSKFEGSFAEIEIVTGINRSSELVTFGPFRPTILESLKDPIVADVDLAIQEIAKQCGVADIEVRAAVLVHLTANDNPF
ncbi:hypothetical protein AAIH70_25835 [Neorhizobium sp. BT27B]|uniref:hypothetical protein n=1 Tax=Neorhizobium sp. BT27B TaxID=3142625 RepID=UPI003D27FCD0